MITRATLALAESLFFLLAFLFFVAAFADCADGIPGFQPEAIASATAAVSGVVVDVVRGLRRRGRREGRIL